LTSLIYWRSAAARAGFTEALAKAPDGKDAAVILTLVSRASGSR